MAVDKKQRGQSAWQPRMRAAQMVGCLMPDVLRPAFEKYGFPAAAILTEWPAIAGSALAAFTAPERLTWPRGGKHQVAAGSGANASRSSTAGATLLLRVDGARALEVQHRTDELIERINSSFGYAAITKIRIIQAPVIPPAVKPAVMTAAMAQPLPEVALPAITDDRLRVSLQRMARGIRNRDQRSWSVSDGDAAHQMSG